MEYVNTDVGNSFSELFSSLIFIGLCLGVWYFFRLRPNDIRQSQPTNTVGFPINSKKEVVVNAILSCGYLIEHVADDKNFIILNKQGTRLPVFLDEKADLVTLQIGAIGGIPFISEDTLKIQRDILVAALQSKLSIETTTANQDEPRSLTEELERLSKLKSDGLLTEEEFQTAKGTLLKKG
jgi:hypothetical protein